MLAKNLKIILEERKISVAVLARESGCSKTNIHGWLAGSNPQMSQLLKVAQYLGVTVDFLLTGVKHDKEEDLSALLKSVEIHSGIYQVIIKKLAKN